MPEPTAGRSAGTEQGQGREELDEAFVDLRRWPCDSCGLPRSSPLHGNPFGSGHPFRPSPSVPPARDSGNGGALGQVTAHRNAQSGRDEAREAVARWLCEWDANGSAESGWTDSPRDDLDASIRALYLGNADVLFALPAVAALLRDGTTT